MTRMSRWVHLFIFVQVAGLVCMWSWPHFSAISAALWGTALIFLFPGNFISAVVAEKLLWNSGLSLAAMSAIELPFLIAINFVVWYVLAAAFRKLMHRR